MARLREQENVLKGLLQKQELLLHRLQSQNQPVDNNKVNQTQDTEYAGLSGPQNWKTAELVHEALILEKQTTDNLSKFILHNDCVHVFFILCILSEQGN